MSTAAIVDISELVLPVAQTVAMVAAAFAMRYLPPLVAALEKRAGIELTVQQSDAIKGFVQTAAGVLETKLDQGALSLSHINISNPTVLMAANAILADAPIAAHALGMTEAGVAKMIVGAVDTAPRTPTPIAAPAPIPIPALAGASA